MGKPVIVNGMCSNHDCHMIRASIRDNEKTFCPKCEITKLDQRWAVMPEQDELFDLLSDYYVLSNILADLLEHMIKREIT